MELSMNGFPRSVLQVLWVSDLVSYYNQTFEITLYFKWLMSLSLSIFPEVTSLASGPAMTHDRRGSESELLLCLQLLNRTLAHCTRYNVNNVSVSSLSTQGHLTLWRAKMTWRWEESTALKKNAGIRRTLPCVPRFTFSLIFQSAFMVLTEYPIKREWLIMGISFLTFNMDVSCVVLITLG